MKKLIKLSKVLSSLGLKKESIEILKIAQSLPDGYEIEPESTSGAGGFGVPGHLTDSLLRKNLNLKEIFAREYNKDPSFFDSFTYIHFPRGSESSNADFVRSYGPRSGGNPTELSVVGSPVGSPCSVKNNSESYIGGSRSIAFLMDGTPTSAFYHDATSSYYAQMQNDQWIKALEDAGINPDEYNPKIINITEGRLSSFFFNKESYDAIASSGHSSDYHEIILKNAKVKKVLIDDRINKDELINFFEDIDPYWIGKSSDKIIDVIYCSGSANIEGLSARTFITSYVKSFFYTDNNVTKLDTEIFENTFIFPPRSEDFTETIAQRESDGLEVLKDAINSDVDPYSVISSANSLIRNNKYRQEKIDELMSGYTSGYSNSVIIETLESIWLKAFTDDRYKVHSNFIPRTSSSEGLKYPAQNYSVVEEFVSPIFKKIKDSIVDRLKSKEKIKSALYDYITFIKFLSTDGLFVYEKNIKNKAFDYFLTMINEMAEITEIIYKNKDAKEILPEIEEADILRSIYYIKDHASGGKILTMIINIFNESPVVPAGEVEGAVSMAEEEYSDRKNRQI